jgi:hypothetical protein
MAGKEKITEAERRSLLEDSVWELSLKGFSVRNITKKLSTKVNPVSHMTVQRILKKREAEVAEAAKDLLERDKSHILKQLQRIDQVAAIAWEGLENSIKKSITVVKSTENVIIKGDEENARLPAEKVKDSKTTATRLADPRWVTLVLQTIAERARHLHLFDKQPDEDPDVPVDKIIHQQEIYIPGIGAVTSEMVNNMFHGDQQGQDMWHALAALMQNQEPHVWNGEHGPTSSNK